MSRTNLLSFDRIRLALCRTSQSAARKIRGRLAPAFEAGYRMASVAAWKCVSWLDVSVTRIFRPDLRSRRNSPVPVVQQPEAERRPRLNGTSMKVLICGDCMAIVGLPQDTSTIECRCGNARARWIDPQLGTVEVDADRRANVRILGLHNSFLLAAMTDPECDDLQWRGRHALCVDAATFDDADRPNPFADTHRFAGHSLFSYDNRRCWAVLITPGETDDVVWADVPAAVGDDADATARFIAGRES